jgi:hypothetical protein
LVRLGSRATSTGASSLIAAPPALAIAIWPPRFMSPFRPVVLYVPTSGVEKDVKTKSLPLRLQNGSLSGPNVVSVEMPVLRNCSRRSRASRPGRSSRTVAGSARERAEEIPHVREGGQGGGRTFKRALV